MKLTVTMFITLDGVAQAPGARQEDRENGFELGGWLVPHLDEDFNEATERWASTVDAFLLGRKTYQIMETYWPHVDPETDTMSDQLNNLRKYVPTRTLTEASWANTTLLTGDLVAEVTKLKELPGRDLQVHGSPTLVQQLLRARLVDELRLLVFPVVLGTGKNMWHDIAPTGLRLAESKASSTGVMLQVYQVAGEPLTGALDPA
ncbi:dihydrofolate reductase family protein [Nonomuraea soli]|uniref:Dihydrofolate reductase n=1 Tax=Nonomuraea soli TaxID=1032476 RepID=A0A7W0CFV2_9ACTN|nr:dihydrofolate reductase family protein [Nonomuraea soli]MBA2890219.1 dihydrofolate reductase [Nonomuraea soli]